MKLITLHASMTDASKDIGKLELEKRDRQYGYFQVGYHYIVRRNGMVEIGRPEKVEYPQKNCGLAVCLVGGSDVQGAPTDNFTDNQKTALVGFLDHLQKRENYHVQVVSRTPAVQQNLLDTIFNGEQRKPE